MKRIERVYTSEVARTYETTEKRRARWRREAEIVVPLLRRIPPGAAVIDVAAGTGRWLPVYKMIGARPILLDSSEDMLAQARQRAVELEIDVSIRVESAVGAAPFPPAEWAVITAFFNWIPLRDVERVLRKLLDAGVARIVMMITYMPSEAPVREALRERRSVLARNLGSRLGWRSKGIYHFHREAAVRALLRRLGLDDAEEHLIVGRPARRNVMIVASRH